MARAQCGKRRLSGPERSGEGRGGDAFRADPFRARMIDGLQQGHPLSLMRESGFVTSGESLAAGNFRSDALRSADDRDQEIWLKHSLGHAPVVVHLYGIDKARARSM